MRLIAAVLFGVGAWGGFGCQRPQAIDVDLSSTPVRFLITHQGWPAPLVWPRVKEFAVASEADGVVWQLESGEGEGLTARDLAIVYGRVPSGFVQVEPASGKAPAPFVRGRSYYIAAGGDDAVYRMVFSLPVSAIEAGMAGQGANRPRELREREDVPAADVSGAGRPVTTQPVRR